MANNDLLVQSNLSAMQKPAGKPQGIENVPTASARVEQEKAESAKEPGKAVLLEQVKSEDLQDKVTQLNDHMQNLQRNLHFMVDENSGDTVVQVIDKQTKEVVKQIPSEEILNARHAMEKYQGLLLEVKA